MLPPLPRITDLHTAHDWQEAMTACRFAVVLLTILKANYEDYPARYQQFQEEAMQLYNEGKKRGFRENEEAVRELLQEAVLNSPLTKLFRDAKELVYVGPDGKKTSYRIDDPSALA